MSPHRERLSPTRGERLGDDADVLLGHLLRDRRQDPVPERQHRTSPLHHAGGASHRPQVQMRRAVVPPPEVTPRDTGDALHRLRDPLHQGPERREHLDRRVLEQPMLTRGDRADERQPTDLPPRAHLPMLVVPDRELARGAGSAFGRVQLAAAGLLRHQHRFKRSHRDRLEGPRQSLGDGGGVECLADREPAVERGIGGMLVDRGVVAHLPMQSRTACHPVDRARVFDPAPLDRR